MGRLDISEDIRSLTEFKRNTSDLLERLKATGRPVILTVNGKAEIVVQDATSYQGLLERVEAIEAIQRGLRQAGAGKTRPARKSLERIRKKRQIPRK